jgi:hypothetical protein
MYNWRGEENKLYVGLVVTTGFTIESPKVNVAFVKALALISGISPCN